MEVQSKAGLIGYYEGTVKGCLRILQSIPEEKQTSEVKTVINSMEELLEAADYLWEKVKMY